MMRCGERRYNIVYFVQWIGFLVILVVSRGITAANYDDAKVQTLRARGETPVSSNAYKVRQFDDESSILLEAKAPWTVHREKNMSKMFVLETYRPFSVEYSVKTQSNEFASFVERFSDLVTRLSDRREIRWIDDSASGSRTDVVIKVKEKSLTVRKCINCATAWYSTSVGVHDRGRGSIHFTPSIVPTFLTKNEKDTNSKIYHRQSSHKFDIAVPYACLLDTLLEFASLLPLSKLPRAYDVRLLVTNYECRASSAKNNISSIELRKVLAARSHLAPDKVVVVDTLGSFERAKSCNALHAIARDDATLLVIDVDMRISPAYFENAEALVVAGASVYFPIVWSTYSPQSLKRIACFRANATKLSSCPSDVEPLRETDLWYGGYWRAAGYGMYAIAGSDAKLLTMDESFVHWGGEDKNFLFERVLPNRHVVRMRELALVHHWHEHRCETEGEGEFDAACIKVTSKDHASPLAWALELNENRYDASISPSSRTLLIMTSRVRDLTATIRKANFYAACGLSVAIFYSRSACEQLPEKCTLGTVGRGTTVSAHALDEDETYPPQNIVFAMYAWLSEHLELALPLYTHVVAIDNDCILLPHAVNDLLRLVGNALYAGRSGRGRAEERDGLGLDAPFCLGGTPVVYTTQVLLEMRSKAWRACLSSTMSDHSDTEIGRCIYAHLKIGCNAGLSADANAELHRRLFTLTGNFHEGTTELDSADAKWPQDAISIHPLKDEARWWLIMNNAHANGKFNSIQGTCDPQDFYPGGLRVAVRNGVLEGGRGGAQ
eukprot:g484.t1